MASDVTQRIAAASSSLVTTSSYVQASREAAQSGQNAERVQQAQAAQHAGRINESSRSMHRKDVVEDEKDQHKSDNSTTKAKAPKHHSNGKRNIAVA